MDKENNEKIEYGEPYTPMFDLEDCIISKEDFKFKDNTKPRKIKLSNRNYDFLFSEEESVRIHKLVEKYCYQAATKGQGLKWLATSLRLRFIEKVKHIYALEDAMYDTLLYLTVDINEKQREAIMESFQTNPIVEKAKTENGVTTLETKIGKIQFSEIGNLLPNLEIDDDIKDIEYRMGDLEDEGNCHYEAVETSKKLKSIGIENNVVTARRAIIADKVRYLHSWNEFQMNGKEYVLDYESNLIMNKEGYYALNHIDKVISEISCEDIIKDEKICTQVNIDYKTYLTCRDEVMRDFQKNIDIFDKER